MSNLAIDLIYATISQTKVNYIQYDTWGFDGGKYTERMGWSPEFGEPISQ